MKRRLLAAVLALGAVLGFGCGIYSVWYHRVHGYGPPAHFSGGRRHDFEARVADICVQAAERVLHKERGQPGSP